jgi:polyhydroxyalkanoate synthase
MPGVPILPLHVQAQDFDREIRAAVGRATGSLSVASALLAGIDWWVNLLVSPGKRAELQLLALKQAHVLGQYAAACFAEGHVPSTRCVAPPARDRRFDDEAWQHWPFNVLHQSFLMTEQWWAEATRGVAGVEPHHEQLFAFIGRQLLDMASPGNSLWTNHVALKATREEGGLNLLRAGEYRLDPDAWLAAAPDQQGSWWPAWHEWLREHSGVPVEPPRMGLPGARVLDDAPGRYVLET